MSVIVQSCVTKCAPQKRAFVRNVVKLYTGSYLIYVIYAQVRWNLACSQTLTLQTQKLPRGEWEQIHVKYAN